jgi:hypothetical protein
MWQKGACLPRAITFSIEVEKMRMEGALDNTLWLKMLQSSNQILVQNGSKVWHHSFLFNFSAIFEVVSYLEEGSWGVGGFFPFLKPFFKKGLKKVLCLGLWHQHHESSYLNLKFKLIFMFLHSITHHVCALNSLPYPPSRLRSLQAFVD